MAGIYEAMQTQKLNAPCGHCGMYHNAVCPRVKAIEYHPDGNVKRVEYHAQQPFVSSFNSHDLAVGNK